MRISTKGRYAIRFMIDIARHAKDGNVSLKDVSARQNISLKYLEQIVNSLAKAGYVKSQRGAQGGYKLTRSPAEYTIGGILRITEGSMAPVECLADEVNQCTRAEQCPTVKMWEGLYKVINDYLESVTIEDLMDGEDNSDFMYCI